MSACAAEIVRPACPPSRRSRSFSLVRLGVALGAAVLVLLSLPPRRDGGGVLPATAAIPLGPAPLSAPMGNEPDLEPPIRLAGGTLVHPVDYRVTAHEGLPEMTARSGRFENLPYFRFHLGPLEARATESLFPAVAREASADGAAVMRLGLPRAVATRFGEADMAEAELVDADGVARSCHVYRWAQSDLELSFSGWLCDADTPAGRPERIACLIDGLRLAPDSDVLPLRLAFRQAAPVASRCASTDADIVGPVAATEAGPVAVTHGRRAGRAARMRQRTSHSPKRRRAMELRRY